jgi:hypothetical protein
MVALRILSYTTRLAKMEGGGGDILSFFSHSNYLLASRATKSSILHCDTFLVFDVLLEFLEKNTNRCSYLLLDLRFF